MWNALSSRTLILVVLLLLASIRAAAAEDADASPEVARIEELTVQLEGQRSELAAIEALAIDAAGSDRAALESQAIEVRSAGADTLSDLAAAVLELELPAEEATPYRKRVGSLLPQLTASLPGALGTARRGLAELKTERDAAAPEALAEVEQRLRRQDAWVARILDVGVAHADTLDQFELPSESLRGLLREEAATRALLVSSHMHLAATQLADAQERSSTAPEDATLQTAVAEAAGRLAWRTDALSAVVAQMEALEMDTAQYKQLLIEATGEISTDIFDADVGGEFVTRWAESVRESVAQDGPSVIFSTLVFVLVLAAFWALARFVRTVTRRAVEAPHLRFSQLLKRMIVSLASGTVLAIGLLVALSQLGVEVGPVVAGLGIAGFVVGFALQDTLANFAAGVMILAYRPYDVGELIECAGGVFGTVSHMNLVSTTILTVDNQTRIVPNGKIWGDVITNLSAQKRRRVDLLVGISYEDDIPHAEKVIWSILEEHDKVLADPEPVVKVHELGDSSVNLAVRPWTTPDDYWDVYWDITREVKLRFDREGVSIPFPQRDVHFYPADPQAPSAAGAE